jgi:hypothetical protein
MDLRATAAAATPATTTTTASTTTTDASATSPTAGKTSFAALFTEAQKDLKPGERLTRVTGHHFARIKGGERDDECVNLSGNKRNGQVFDLIWRNGHSYHVYGGTGADHVVIDMGPTKKTSASAKTDAAAGGTSAA